MRPPTVCRWLQTKAWFFPPLADGARVDGGADGDSHDPEAHTTPFWCNRTQDAVGPDGDPVGESDCTGRRGCCELDIQP